MGSLSLMEFGERLSVKQVLVPANAGTYVLGRNKLTCFTCTNSKIHKLVCIIVDSFQIELQIYPQFEKQVCRKYVTGKLQITSDKRKGSAIMDTIR